MTAIAADDRSGRTWRLLVAVAAVAGGLSVWALTGFNPFLAPFVIVAAAGAATVALLIPNRPVAAVGVVFLLAVFERFEIATAVGTMRLEQPAIVALLAAMIWHRHRLDLPSLRPVGLLLTAATIYLGSLALSSAVVAEVPALSLRIVIWSALSMIGGLLAALLLYRRARLILPWLAATGAVLATIGFVTAISYVLFGGLSPLFAGTEATPRVFLPAYEPNLYASLLALLTPIGIELYRASSTRRNLVLGALPLLALALGTTRAAYIALAIGLVVFFVLHLRLNGWDVALRRAAAVTVGATIVGLVLPLLLLNPAYSGLIKPAAPAISDPGRPDAQPTASPRPDDELIDLDTFDYRIKRVEIGLHEWKESPIIGRGAYSYGQRHIDSKDRPEVIAVLPVLVLHDSGVVGLVALGAFLVMLAVLLWRASRDRLRAPPAIALGAAVLIMLIGYLSTTALHFAVTWIVIGAALAAAWPEPSVAPRPDEPADKAP